MVDEDVVFLEFFSHSNLKSGKKRSFRQMGNDSVNINSSSRQFQTPRSVSNEPSYKRRKSFSGTTEAAVVRSTDEPAACDSPQTYPKRNSLKTQETPWVIIVDLTIEDEDASSSNKIKEDKTGKQYIPSPGSVARDMLVAIARKDQLPRYRGYMLKPELISEAHQIRTLSTNKALNISRFSSSDALKKLVKGNLLVKGGKPAEFRITDQGRAIAADIMNFDSNYREGRAGASTFQLFQEMTTGADIAWSLEANSFDIILYVDKGELNAKNRDEELLGRLTARGVRAEAHKLFVGDYVWVAQSRDLKSQKLVLPFVVERKRMDDLRSSLDDGRLEDQKSRLIKTGLTVIYIIEECSNGRYLRGFETYKAISKAKSILEQVDGLVLEKSTSLKDTCRHLAQMTRNFIEYYKNKSLKSCPIEEWPQKKHAQDKIFLQLFSDFNLHGGKGCS